MPWSGSRARWTTRPARLVWAPNLPQWLARIALVRSVVGAISGFAFMWPTTPTWRPWGKRSFGAGAGIDGVVAYLTISTGIGAGVVDWGRSSCAGPTRSAEFGHSWSTGAPGARAGPAHWKNWRRAAAWPAWRVRAASDRWTRRGARGGTHEATAGRRTIWEDAVAAVRPGVCNLVMSFAPRTVIIGGGIGRRPEFFDPLRRLVLQRTGNRPTELRVILGALGDDAGLAGAARGSERLGVTR